MPLKKLQETNMKVKDERRYTVMKESSLEIPDLWMEVYIQADEYEYPRFAEMFARARCSKAESLDKADLVVFGGGPDINPSRYLSADETIHQSCFFDDKRDKEDFELMDLCIEKRIPMFGVCRGAQLLHVGNGGSLYQDIDEHTGDHPIWDLTKSRLVQRVSSVHHQSCIRTPLTGNDADDADGMELIATARKSHTRWLTASMKEEGGNDDVEAFFYPATCSLGVQGHPEYRGYDEFMLWTLNLIQDYIVCNPHVDLREGYRRLTLVH